MNKTEICTINCSLVPYEDDDIISFFRNKIDKIKIEYNIRSNKKLLFEVPYRLALEIRSRFSAKYDNCLKQHIQELFGIEIKSCFETHITVYAIESIDKGY